VKWDAGEEVEGAVLGPLGTRTEEDLRGLQKENVAVCMQGDTTITAVFEFAPNPNVTRQNGTIRQCVWNEDEPVLRRAGVTLKETPWTVLTEAYPGEIVKLTIADPELVCIADAGTELTWQWSKMRADDDNKFIKGEIETYNSSDEGTLPNDICYVETVNKYVEMRGALGVLQIRTSAGAKVLKTIVIVYKDIEKENIYPLKVLAHAYCPGITKEWVIEALKDRTNEIFLCDSLPYEEGHNSIKERYENHEDEHCPIAIVLDPSVDEIPTFMGVDVNSNGFKHWYNDIKEDEAQRFEELTGYWSNMSKRYGIDLVIVEDLCFVDGVTQMNGRINANVSMFVCAFRDDPFDPDNPDDVELHALPHEWGHYKAGLYDIYVHEPADCRRPPNGGEGVDICDCPGKFYEKEWDPSPEHPENLMSNTTHEGLLPSDRTALGHQN